MPVLGVFVLRGADIFSIDARRGLSGTIQPQATSVRAIFASRMVWQTQGVRKGWAARSTAQPKGKGKKRGRRPKNMRACLSQACRNVYREDAPVGIAAATLPEKQNAAWEKRVVSSIVGASWVEAGWALWEASASRQIDPG